MSQKQKSPDAVRFIYQFFRIILIILFFPLSLIFVAYFKQQKAKKEYYRNAK